MDTTEDLVDSVAQKVLGSAGPGGMDSEVLQGWLIKFGDHRKKQFISVKYFVYWLANQNPPWDTYLAFMFFRLIALDKVPGVRPVGVGEMWRQLFARFVLKVTGSETTHACKDDHLCAGLRAVIYGEVHGVQSI